tara:strand:- start:729 stop:1421 length:693 start_codon:yes stop_codon:yes gene_type:complete
MDKSNTLSFSEIISASTSKLTTGQTLTVSDILLGLFASLVCAFIISYSYKNAYQGVLYQKSFNLALILITLITTGVIMVISGNLILSLGMVGALSIVRFRSAIKDPLDIVFMFWAVFVGIANGVANLKVSFTTTIVIFIIMMIVKKLPLATKSFLLIVKCKPEAEDELINIISENCKKYYLKSKNINNDQLELILEANINDEKTLSKKMLDYPGIIDANILSYSSNFLDN